MTWPIWKFLPHYWTLVNGIQQWPVDSTHKGKVIWWITWKAVEEMVMLLVVWVSMTLKQSHCNETLWHYGDVIMGTIASQITSLIWLFTQPFIQTQIKKKHQSSTSLAFVRGIHRRLVNSLHKWPVTRKMFPFDDIIMDTITVVYHWHSVVSMHGNIFPTTCSG